MKERICVLLGTAGACLAGLFGGWDASLGTLLLFMGIDYITGAATAVCGKSPKSGER
ncbi:MAG: phage holin family protein [Ruminococcus sp.]